MTSLNSGPHTCSNCFAVFDWTPFVQDGDDFCCSGCAGGGPCICTYAGGPHVTGVTGPDEPAGRSASGPRSPIEEPAVAGEQGPGEPGGDGQGVAASENGGNVPGPPEEPPAPAAGPGDEPPGNGRLAIIMAAVAEMPLPVQEVVRARLSTNVSEEEIGEPLGLTADEVRQLIRQGQAILNRTIGPGFQIRYVGAEGTAREEAPGPEFPLLGEAAQPEEGPETPREAPVEAGPTAPEFPPPREAAQPDETDLGRLIARSVASLTGTTAGEGPAHDAAREAFSEALREAGNLFRLASERLAGTVSPETPLRAAFSEPRDDGEAVSLIVENPGDVSQFFMALQAAESVRWARLEALTHEVAEFRLATSSLMDLVRDLMALAGDLRPTRLQLSGDEIRVELPPREPVAAPVSRGEAQVQRFELTVDSFFGARHFVQSGGGQNAPHHHSYRVEASFVTPEPDNYGFVVGFAEIRQIVDRSVMEYSETLLNTEEPFREIPPTTENLARVFHQKISARLAQLDQPGVSLSRVRVWESPTNSASYSNTRPDAAATA